MFPTSIQSTEKTAHPDVMPATQGHGEVQENPNTGPLVFEVPCSPEPEIGRDEVLTPRSLHQLRTWQRFHIKLILLYGGTVLAALILIGWHFYQVGTRHELASLQQRLMVLVTSLADAIDAEGIAAVPLQQRVRTPVHEELYERFGYIAGQDPDIEAIYIMRPTDVPTKLHFFIDYAKGEKQGVPGNAYDASDVPMMLAGFTRPTVEDEPYGDEFGLSLSGYAPIRDGEGKSVAIVGIDVQASRIQAMHENVLWSVLSVFGGATVVITVISLFVAGSVRNPLTRIIDAASAIAVGELSTRVRMRRNDEFGIVSQHFDRMAQGLEEREFIRATFGRYVSEDVAKALLSDRQNTNLGGEERIVTVLLSDLRGYSTISERLPPAKVIEMLNCYFEAMTLIIDARGGCIIEFLGDSILVAFGAPNYVPDHEERAMRCAIDMRSRLHDLNADWQQSGLANYWNRGPMATLGARIGVHTGPVVVGNVGGNKRMKYAVIGDTVNVAARLEDLNRELGSDICVSSDVYAHLPDELEEQLSDRGENRVKGRDGLVRVYTI